MPPSIHLFETGANLPVRTVELLRVLSQRIAQCYGQFCGKYESIMNQNRVQYDKSTDILETSGPKVWLVVQFMKLAELFTRPFGHTGISRLHGFIGSFFPKNSKTTINLQRGGIFTYPSGDYYYNRLLTRGWDYEGDTQAILLALKTTSYTFIDIGANFGFFSCLAASPSYGAKRVVAIEPARKAFEILQLNLKPFGEQATLIRLAVDEKSGAEVILQGDRHAGFSLVAGWGGAAGASKEIVLTTSIDDLIAKNIVAPQMFPILIKLEVEGIEIRALRGATATLASDTAFIIEEVERRGISEAIRFIFAKPGFSLYYSNGSKFICMSDLASFEKYRTTQQGVQRRGTSVLAFGNSAWKERLKSIID